MTAENDGVRADFFQWLNSRQKDSTSDPRYLEVWQASRERYVPRWISVDESLPETGTWCIVLKDNRLDYLHGFLASKKPDTEVKCGRLGYVDEEGCGYWDHGSLASGVPFQALDNVTMWQPLPATPNGGNES